MGMEGRELAALKMDLSVGARVVVTSTDEFNGATGVVKEPWAADSGSHLYEPGEMPMVVALDAPVDLGSGPVQEFCFNAKNLSLEIS